MEEGGCWQSLYMTRGAETETDSGGHTPHHLIYVRLLGSICCTGRGRTEYITTGGELDGSSQRVVNTDRAKANRIGHIL
jgi:hypothetical protein